MIRTINNNSLCTELLLIEEIKAANAAFTFLPLSNFQHDFLVFVLV